MTDLATHRFQPPKGTRDFYPADMALRRHVERTWREVSINHGFDEIDGPTFEHLDLYTVKSGEGIVSELFSFRRAGGDTDYALRPEFTPTLARMYAAKANSLPSPTKWFCIPSHFRAERPQRGRLREFIQWNVDIIGDPSPRADAEIIAVAVEVLRGLGLRGADITVRLSHRDMISTALAEAGVETAQVESAMALLDRRDKLDDTEFSTQCDMLGLDLARYDRTIADRRDRINAMIADAEQTRSAPPQGEDPAMQEFAQLIAALDEREVLKWCEFDPSIVRGLAYYTGTVFEIHESSGRERAIAGGGRYDRLIEMFGGPPTPAVGIAMGDVVLRNILSDKGLLKPAEEYLPRPDVFLITDGSEPAERLLPHLLTRLRREGLHARHSYRATRNIGKLLGEADRVRARCAIILGSELQQNHVVVKDLSSGDQREISLDDLDEAIVRILETQGS